ncbi:MAG: hypothetical protein H8E38_06715 [SAR324 cluster bacterium]|nr:hypothetical protein [SAR324 cluster bacterium]MBL7034760.1 hypothetical protein [SAR324 cluster bacterium]
MKKIDEEEIKGSWPSAVEGELEHPEFGLIHFWTGEQRGRIVVRFSFECQTEGESHKVFFIDLSQEGWVLQHISSFQFQNSKLKLIKSQSFREQDDLEQKYRSIIDLFLETRESNSSY